MDFSSEKISVNNTELLKFQKEIDSLRLMEIEKRKPKIYAFNPNYITDHKGATLGMTNEEIDRLLAFRKQNNWINSAEQFQEVTKVSDSLLKVISPYFKFPEWVTNPVPKPEYKQAYNSSPKTFQQKQDLNKATAEELQKINGIGEVLSDRIIKFRNKFAGGFIDNVQLQDVYGLTPETIERINEAFIVKTPRPIKKIVLNEATVDELVTIQHIDYNLAFDIVEQRQLREGYKSFEELKKVKDFPINKIDIIKLYLLLD
jgi:competence ComEA-like helix-hairpin-helix protein